MATTNDHYSQLVGIPATPETDDGVTTSVVRVRDNGGGTRYECAYSDTFDYWGSFEHVYDVQIRRVVGGAAASLHAVYPGAPYVGIRLEVVGTALTAKATTDGSTWSTVWSETDANIESGSPTYSAPAGGTWTEGDIAGGPVPGTCPLPALDLAPTIEKAEIQVGGIPGTAPLVPADLSPSIGHLGVTTLAVRPPSLYTDNFNALVANQQLSTPWKTNLGMPYGGSSTYLGAVVVSGSKDAYYTGTIGPNHYSAVRRLNGTGLVLIARGNWQNRTGYYAFTTSDTAASPSGKSWSIRKRVTLSVRTLAEDVSVGLTFPLRDVWFEATSLSPGQPVRLRLYGDGQLIGEAWDDGTHSADDGGYPMPSAVIDGGSPGIYASGNNYYDDFATGEVGTPPTPGTCPLPGVSLDPSLGHLGEPQPASIEVLPVSLSPTVGNMGEPFEGEAPVLSLSLDPEVGRAELKVSRVKQTAVYPSFSAFGGTNTYTAALGTPTQKGQIASGSERTIGYRVGIGNDGAAGDRVFFSVPANELLRGDGATAAKATLHLVFQAMQSWDYRAAGDDARVRGDAFKIRKVVSGSGMDAVLAGDYGTIEARPIWLSGQTWYDGATRGQPVWDCVVDVTALYNEAAQAGTALSFALECVFTHPRWLAEIIGNDPGMEWARPRLEVHRWGDVGFEIADSDTATPTISVTPPAGGTLTEIRWGYDPDCTPAGGIYKYRPDDRRQPEAYTLGGFRPGGDIEGRFTASPALLPMLASSSRVFVEAEVDFGTPGAQVFRRTFKTPQVFAPKIQASRETLREVGTDTGGVGEDQKWYDVRGPFLGPSATHLQTWQMFVKRYVPAWEAGNVYPPGSRVVSNGVRWYTANGGTSGPVAPDPQLVFDAGTGDVLSVGGAAVQDGVGGVGGVAWSWQAPTAGQLAYLPDAASPDSVDPWVPSLGWNQAAPGYGWDLFRLHDYPTAAFHEWQHVVGLGGVADANLYPSAGSTDANLGMVYTGRDLHIQAHDVGQPVHIQNSQHAAFLYSELTDGQYHVRLGLLQYEIKDTDGTTWGSGNWEKSFFFFRSAVLYTSEAPVDLRLSSVALASDDTRGTTVDRDMFAPVLVAFVADGSLRVMVSRPFTDGIAGEGAEGGPSGYFPYVCRDGWTVEQAVAVPSDVTSVSFAHLLTREGVHRTVLAAASPTSGWIGYRTNDVAEPQNGGGWSITRGTWSSRALAFTRAWATDTMPTTATGNIPDHATVALAVQTPDGSVDFLGSVTPSEYSPGYNPAAGRDAAVAPASDFTHSVVLTPAAAYKHRAVWRFPETATVSAIGATINGGAVTLIASGTELRVQRVTDFLRVSEARAVTVDQTNAIEHIYAHTDGMWLEGVPTPVVTKHADGWRTVMVTVGQDPERMDEYRRSPVTVARFSSGDAYPIKETSNMRDVSRIEQITPVAGVSTREVAIIERLVGHNCYTTSWYFDENGNNPDGMMNEGGWLYFAMRGRPGDRYRLLIPNTPLFGGIWKNGAIYPGELSWGYQECLGGLGWMNGRFATWMWTNQPPSTPNRQWHRVMDGMDYVLDGESNGGLYVIDIRSPGATLYLAHDLVTDIALWKADVAAWLSMPTASRIKWVNGKGELLYGTGPRADEPLSEVATESIVVTWPY